MKQEEFQSTRPVWGATPAVCMFSRMEMFQSTRPVWGATSGAMQDMRRSRVSIHAPRVGRDFIRRLVLNYLRGFNPRAPCGARPAT